MSLNPIPLRVLPSIDPVINLNRERQFAVYDGGKEVSYTPFFAQAPNNSNINIRMDPPDENTVVDPRIYVKVDYNLSFVGVGPGVADPLLTPGVFDAPRAFPIASTTSTLDVKVNGTSVNTNLNEYFSPLTRMGNYIKEYDLDFSTCPSMLDQFQTYADWQTLGSARNPMALYGENSTQQSRGAYLNPATGGANYQVNTHTNATVVFSSVEPLFVSPFYNSKSGFMCKTLNATWTFSDLRRVWSHAVAASSGVISSLVVNITGLTTYVRFISPKELSKIPRHVCYPYHEVLPLVTTLQVSVPAGTSAQIPMNAVNLQAIPRRLLICVRRQDSDLISGALNYTYSDTFARIDQITINWANNQGKLSSASIYDLYNIHRKNGGNLSYTQWSNFVGSVLPIDLGKDIGLDSLSAPGRLTNPQLSMTVNFTNTSSAAVTYSLFVNVIYEGTFTIADGNVTKNIAVINSQDVLNSEKMDVSPLIEHNEDSNWYGGSLWDDIKSTFGKVNKFLKRTKAISSVSGMVPHPLARKVSRVARALGYGEGLVEMAPYHYGEEMQGEGRMKKRKSTVKKKK